MRTVKIVVPLLILLALFACRKEVRLPRDFESEVENIKKSFVPDERTKIFNVVYMREEGHWRMHVETTEEAAKKALEDVIPKYFKSGEIRSEILLLPQVELGDSIYALVSLSVGNMKKAPDHAAELVDQVLLGNTVKILKRQRSWYLIKSPNEYLGWITRGSLQRTNARGIQEWEQQNRIIQDINYTQVYSTPSVASQVVSDAVLGCIFVKTGTQGSWVQVKLPDNRTGFVEAKLFKPYRSSDVKANPGRDKIVARALKMVGIPYLWGGNSIKGFDCSGFTSTVFASEGCRLPRDANMQVLLGIEEKPDSTFSNILPGDLLFFGSEKKISHVAISLGGYEFIHSAAPSYVRINSLDEKNKLYDEVEKKRLKIIKRILND